MKLLKDFKQENNEIGFSFVILCSAWFVEMDERDRDRDRDDSLDSFHLICRHFS